MRSTSFLAWFCALPLLLAASSALAVPPLLLHEGLLLAEDNLPMEGRVTLRFSLYDGADDEDALWTEEHEILLVAGYYQVHFGEQQRLDGVFAAGAPYLGISLNGGAELVPRQPLGSVPYAFVADNAVGDLTPRTITVAGQLIVDDEGTWVGPPVQTPEELLEGLRGVDGQGSGLNADRIDGLDSGQLLQLASADAPGQILQLLRQVDGAGSGLDADLLDGADSTRFMRVDQDTATAGKLVVGKGVRVGAGLVVATGDAKVLDGRLGVGRDPEHTVDVDGFIRARGFLLEGQEDKPESPAPGTIYFDAGSQSFLGYDGEQWQRLDRAGGGGGGGGGGLPPPPPGEDGFEGPLYGGGSDGSLTVANANTVINAYAYVLTTPIPPGSDAFEVNDASGFSVGDEILVIQMQHESNAGVYEFAQVSAKAGNRITVSEGLSRVYYSGGFDRSGAAVTQIVSVPHYENLTVVESASVTAPAWDGRRGGIVAFRAVGRVSVSGEITTTGKGFRGGPQQPSSHRGGYKGESWTGKGWAGPAWYTSVCAGTVNNPNPTDDQAGPNAGGGSGGYGGCHGGGGAGGAYGGPPATQCSTSCDPPGDQRGWGAPECGRSGFWAKPGKAYGMPDLRRVFLGSGGGSGSSYSASAGEKNMGGPGGGIILAFAPSVTVTGSIRADGTQGAPLAGTAEFRSAESTNWQDGSGGAGSGGAILLSFVEGSLGTSRVTAVGGPCGARTGWPGANTLAQRGGNGGVGRIRLDYESLSGTTTPRPYFRDEAGSQGELTVTEPGTVVNAYAEITAGTVTSDSVEIPVTGAADFSAGDEVLILQVQHGRTAGTYEFATVEAVANGSIEVAEGLTHTYFSDRFDVASAAAAQVVRVPHFTNVTVEGQASITAAPWNGRTGGVVAFRASGAVDVFGEIEADGRGFRGGRHQMVSHRGGFSGESWTGVGDQGPVWYTGVCEGTVNNPNPTMAQSKPNGGGGGGGYGGCHGGGGAGGVYGDLPSVQCATACDPPGNQRGWGAPECGRSGFWARPGTPYGTRDLEQLFLGSGGGGGNNYSADAGQVTAGGAGGGVVFIEAAVLNVAGSVSADGGQGDPKAGTAAFRSAESSNWQDGSGGAGSGGSVYLKFGDGTLGQARVTALGGPCGARTGWPGANTLAQRGSNGGVGRIRLDYESLDGNTNPAPFHWIEGGGDADLTIFAPDTVVNVYSEITDITVPAGTREVTVDNAAGFLVGDEVMVIQMQHAQAAGQYEISEIAEKDGDVLTLTEDLTHRYYSSGFDTPGAWAAQVVRLPTFASVTVPEGASITAPPWNGRTGGIIAFRVREELVVQGELDASAKGFRGGPRQPVSHRGGFQGESWSGLGREGPDWYTSVCSGTVNNANPAQAQAGPNAGGGGGGYGGCHGGGGGGGVYGALPASQCGTDCDPQGDQRGWGAPECGRSGYWAMPGVPYGQEDLARLYLGSGGGSANSYSASSDQDNAGGAGGGIVYIEAGGVILQGDMTADGGQGLPIAGTPEFNSIETSNWQDGSGGAGSGGSIHLVFVNGNIGQQRVTAVGGPCGAKAGWPHTRVQAQRGANGGDGRIRIDAVDMAGATLPVAFEEGQ